MTLAEHPIVLAPVVVAKSWGEERWLNSTRPEGPARLAGEGAGRSLAEALAADPSLLGDWTRRLFGDGLPIFTKLIRADFPPLVHVGWRRPVERASLLALLDREQSLLRELRSMLTIESREAFDDFARAYSQWATAQSLERWRREDEASIAERLRPHARPDAPLLDRFAPLRRNRAELVELLNEVDLRAETGNLLLTPAGLVHAIFGLSHQTHPLDRTTAALRDLLGRLRRAATAGARDDQLASTFARDFEALRALRDSQPAPPKNEGWLPATIDGRLLLVEPQQSSDTTYSIADFYTPFVWAGDRVRFRKGDPAAGLSPDDLARQLADVDCGATSIDAIRRRPVPLARASSPGATLSRLVDEPESWPWFTAHQLELRGRPDAVATWQGAPPAGAFQQLVVLDGQPDLVDATGSRSRLSPTTPAFIPASSRAYRLSSTSPTTVLILSIPVPHSPFPHD